MYCKVICLVRRLHCLSWCNFVLIKKAQAITEFPFSIFVLSLHHHSSPRCSRHASTNRHHRSKCSNAPTTHPPQRAPPNRRNPLALHRRRTETNALNPRWPSPRKRARIPQQRREFHPPSRNNAQAAPNYPRHRFCIPSPLLHAPSNARNARPVGLSSL